MIHLSTHRGFSIQVRSNGSGYRPRWADSMYRGWTRGVWASTVDAAVVQARERIDRQYMDEADECWRKILGIYA